VDALHALADYIVLQKGEAIAQLLVLAGTFLAAQAAAAFTFGLSEVADLGLDELADQAINLLKQMVVQYIEGQVIEAAFKRLGPAVERALEGWVFNFVDGGAPTGGGGQIGELMMVDAAALKSHANLMRAHGQTMREHALNLTERLSGVDYS
jgi:hypothetical protein